MPRRGAKAQQGAPRAWAAPLPAHRAASGVARTEAQLLGSCKGPPLLGTGLGKDEATRDKRGEGLAPHTLGGPLLRVWALVREAGVGDTPSGTCPPSHTSARSRGRARLCRAMYRRHWGIQPQGEENRKEKKHAHQVQRQTLPR